MLLLVSSIKKPLGKPEKKGINIVVRLVMWSSARLSSISPILKLILPLIGRRNILQKMRFGLSSRFFSHRAVFGQATYFAGAENVGVLSI